MIHHTTYNSITASEPKEVFWTEDDEWSKNDIKELWTEYNIIFTKDGDAFMVIDKDGPDPYLVIGSEHKGEITFWLKEGNNHKRKYHHMQTFQYFDSFIELYSKLKEKLKEKK